MDSGVAVGRVGVQDPLSDAGAPIVPRWEWRTFGPRVPLPLEFWDGAAGLQEAESEETYLLSPMSPHNVKLREGRVEIKRLERTDAAGLELWQPTLKESFPVSHETLEKICLALGVLPVTISKRRTRLSIFDCSGEHVELHVGHERWESLAFEDEHPDRILAVLHHLHIDSRLNESYPRALRRIVGQPTTQFSSSQGVSP